MKIFRQEAHSYPQSTQPLIGATMTHPQTHTDRQTHTHKHTWQVRSSQWSPVGLLRQTLAPETAFRQDHWKRIHILVRVPNLNSRSFFGSPWTPRPTSIFLHQHVHKGKTSNILLVVTKTTPLKLTKEADFWSDSPPSIARPTWQASEMPIKNSAKASHLNAVREPWPHANQKLLCRNADESRTKVLSVCPSQVVTPTEGFSRWPNFFKFSVYSECRHEKR